MSAVNDSGEVASPVTIECRNTKDILIFLESIKPFCAVDESSATYRLLYKYSLRKVSSCRPIQRNYA